MRLLEELVVGWKGFFKGFFVRVYFYVTVSSSEVLNFAASCNTVPLEQCGQCMGQ